MEETKAEAARIFEVIKAGDPDKAAGNLSFLVVAGLIASADRVRSIQTFIANRHAGGGPALPVGHSTSNPETLQMMMMMLQESLARTKAPKPPDAK